MKTTVSMSETYINVKLFEVVSWGLLFCSHSHYDWTVDKSEGENPSHLGYDAQLLVSSSWHFEESSYCLYLQGQAVMFQKPWIFSSTALRTSNLVSWYILLILKSGDSHVSALTALWNLSWLFSVWMMPVHSISIPCFSFFLFSVPWGIC